MNDGPAVQKHMSKCDNPDIAAVDCADDQPEAQFTSMYSIALADLLAYNNVYFQNGNTYVPRSECKCYGYTEFISHVWRTGWFYKWLSLCARYNIIFASLVSNIGVMTIAIVQNWAAQMPDPVVPLVKQKRLRKIILGVVLDEDLVQDEEATKGIGVLVPFGVCIFLISLFWGHRVKGRGLKSDNIFLDKASIAQCPYYHTTIDAMCARCEEKLNGIRNIGTCLSKSDMLVVLWDKYYFRRLWTVFEIGVYMGTRGTADIQFLPIYMDAMMILMFMLIAFVMVFTSVAALLATDGGNETGPSTWVTTFFSIKGFVFFSLLFMILRRQIALQQNMLADLMHFSLDEAECYNEEDRNFIKRNLMGFKAPKPRPPEPPSFKDFHTVWARATRFFSRDINRNTSDNVNENTSYRHDSEEPMGMNVATRTSGFECKEKILHRADKLDVMMLDGIRRFEHYVHTELATTLNKKVGVYGENVVIPLGFVVIPCLSMSWAVLDYNISPFRLEQIINDLCYAMSFAFIFGPTLGLAFVKIAVLSLVFVPQSRDRDVSTVAPEPVRSPREKRLQRGENDTRKASSAREEISQLLASALAQIPSAEYIVLLPGGLMNLITGVSLYGFWVVLYAYCSGLWYLLPTIYGVMITSILYIYSPSRAEARHRNKRYRSKTEAARLALIHKVHKLIADARAQHGCHRSARGGPNRRQRFPRKTESSYHRPH